MKRISSPSDESPDPKRTQAIPRDETPEQAPAEGGQRQDDQSAVVIFEKESSRIDEVANSRLFPLGVDDEDEGLSLSNYLTGVRERSDGRCDSRVQQPPRSR
jgi:hypothetical protein